MPVIMREVEEQFKELLNVNAIKDWYVAFRRQQVKQRKKKRIGEKKIRKKEEQ